MHLEHIDKHALQVVCLGFFIAIVAHSIHLPLWVSTLVAFALSWRLAQASGYIPALPRWLIVPFVVMGGIGVFATYWTITGRDAGLALLTVMASFKLLESQTHRDALIVIFLSYFLVVTHFLFSQSIFIALYMIFTILFLTASLITLNERNIKIPWKIRFKLSASIIGYSIPLMIILFILVPRVPGPLWGLTHEQRSGITGLSDHMSPGNISNLIQDNSVAFRVDFEGDIPPQRDLYWRGPVMSRFNGKTWFQTTQKKNRPSKVQSYGTRYDYNMTLEAHGKRWLLPLDLPSGIIQESTITSDFEMKSTKVINDLKKYSLTSYTQSQFGLDMSFEEIIWHMEYPKNINKKTIAYGQELRAQFNDDRALVAHVLEQFRTQEYFYTLSPPLLNKEPVDDFLFNTKRGFCEHYSSSFALLMRSAEIPARVVTGYQGGELNKAGNYLIIRQSDAHAWTEVWFEDTGWTRIDPTAAVSPDRVEKNIDAALKDEDVSFQFKTKSTLIGDLLFSWDNVQYQWNNWVLNYNQTKQKNFLKDLGLGIKSTADMVIALVILLTLVTLGYAFISWYKNRPAKPEYYEKLFTSLLNKTKKAGYPINQAESPSEYLKRIQMTLGDNKNKISTAINLYIRIKYSNSLNKEKLTSNLEAIVKQL